LEKITALQHAWEKCFKKQPAEQRITAAVLGELQGYGFRASEASVWDSEEPKSFPRGLKCL
jgi:hypothetical protein